MQYKVIRRDYIGEMGHYDTVLKSCKSLDKANRIAKEEFSFYEKLVKQGITDAVFKQGIRKCEIADGKLFSGRAYSNTSYTGVGIFVAEDK